MTNDDDSFVAEMLAPNEPVADPWMLALRNWGRVVLLLSIPAVGYLIRFHEHLGAASWLAISFIPVGAFVACACHALLAARYSRRTARRAATLPLALGLVVGVYVMVRYLEKR